MRKSKKQIMVGLAAGLVLGLILTASFNLTGLSQAKLTFEPVGDTLNPADVAAASDLSKAFSTVAEHVNPAVVTISTESTVHVQPGSLRGTPFEQFFGRDFRGFFDVPNGGDQKRSGLGSGVIVEGNGIILTNNHVVDGADEIKVRLMDGREFEGKVKGTDPYTDLAVVTIEADHLTALPLGNSDEARVGEWVLAIGSPLNPNLSHTVTAGIISAKGRSGVGLTRYEDYIQTDAAINPGNSGGALVNMKGELIGINSAIATSNGGNVGIGFAIPSNLVHNVMRDIVEKGTVERGWLGVYIQNITPDLAEALKLKSTNGILVTQVQEGSPADKAGLKEEDVIVKFNGKKVNNSVELSTAVAATSPGTQVELQAIRAGKTMTFKADLELLEPTTTQAGDAHFKSRKLGLELSNIDKDTAERLGLSSNQKGVLVTQVEPGSLAAREGLRKGDVIRKVNRRLVASVSEFENTLGKVESGETVLLFIQRNQGHIFVAFQMP